MCECISMIFPLPSSPMLASRVVFHDFDLTFKSTSVSSYYRTLRADIGRWNKMIVELQSNFHLMSLIERFSCWSCQNVSLFQIINDVLLSLMPWILCFWSYSCANAYLCVALWIKAQIAFSIDDFSDGKIQKVQLRFQFVLNEIEFSTTRGCIQKVMKFINRPQ